MHILLFVSIQIGERFDSCLVYNRSARHMIASTPFPIYLLALIKDENFAIKIGFQLFFKG